MKRRKLTLQRLTIRNLEADQLSAVHGGGDVGVTTPTTTCSAVYTRCTCTATNCGLC